MKKAISFLLSLTMAISLLISPTGNAMAASSTATLVFVHTNDVHGHLSVEPYVKAVADAQKSQYGTQNVWTLSAGDVFAGGETVAHMTNGESVEEAMNAAGYDALAIGNNDMPNGLVELMQHDRDTNFPILSANTVFNANAGDLGKEGDLPFQPYAVFTSGEGVKIGVFGLTTTGSPPVKEGDLHEKLPSIETAQKYVDILRNEEGVDVVVALGHCGWPDNDETMSATTATDNNSYQIAMAVNGIDLFVDGHTHSIIGEGKGYVCDNENHTLIVQTGCFGDNIGVVTLTYDMDQNTVIARDAVQLTKEEYTQTYTPDAQVLEVVTKWTDMVNEKLGKVIGHTDILLNGERTGSADGEGIRLAEQNLGNLITDAIRETEHADVSMFAGVRIRSSIEPGDITLGSLYSVFANGGTIVKVEMTGAEIKAKLAECVASAAKGKEAPGFVQVSGIRFTYNTNGEIVSVVMEKDGSEMDDNQTYLVVAEMGKAPDNAEVLYDGDEALVNLLQSYLNSDMYDASRYTDKQGRITRIEAEQ